MVPFLELYLFTDRERRSAMVMLTTSIIVMKNDPVSIYLGKYIRNDDYNARFITIIDVFSGASGISP